MASQPVSIPLTASPPGDMLDTPNMYRPRSDTILTTSSASSSSSPHLQTPQTPSILGVLDPQSRHRADSYGFGEFGKALFHDGPADRRLSEPMTVTGLEVEEEVEVENMLLTGSPVSESTPPVSIGSPATMLPPSVLPGPLPRSVNTLSAVHDEELLAAPSSPAVDKGRTKANSAVRAKLQRSKSSLKEVFRIKSSALGGSSTLVPADMTDDIQLNDERRRPRFRSLLSFSGSRASSTASIRSINTITSASAGAGNNTLPPGRSITPMPDREGAIAALDTPELTRPDTPPPRAMTLDHPPADETEVDSTGSLSFKAPWTQRRIRPLPSSAVSTNKVLRYTSTPPPMTRSATAPILAEGTFGRAVTQGRDAHGRLRRDLFSTMLPRELKVMVFKSMLDMRTGDERQARWDGTIGARRELVRFSRVSDQDGHPMLGWLS